MVRQNRIQKSDEKLFLESWLDFSPWPIAMQEETGKKKDSKYDVQAEFSRLVID